MTSTIQQVRKVAVLGANGAMGSGSGELFAADGIETTFLARDHEKAREGLERAQSMAKSERLSDFVRLGTYDHDLDGAVGDADLIFEALAEELPLKQEFFERIDRHRRADSIVATVSSGLSIAAMAAGRSDSFRGNFLGIHLFNPPNVITGCEVIPHGETAPAVIEFVTRLLETRLGRKVVRTADLPAFAGNRVGFKVLNEVAQLAAEHGVAFMDALVGPHTGRAMAPLATIDLVGWDVHRAIVDNVHANMRDEAHATFAAAAIHGAALGIGSSRRQDPAEGWLLSSRRRRESSGSLRARHRRAASIVPRVTRSSILRISSRK